MSKIILVRVYAGIYTSNAKVGEAQKITSILHMKIKCDCFMNI